MNEIFKLFGTIALDGVDDAEREINDLTKTASKSESKLIGTFKKIGAAVAAAFAVDKIISFGQEIVSTAATVAAEQSAFAQIMGDYSEEAAEKMGLVAKATGKVDTALTPYMTSMTAKFKGLGFGIEEATDYAVRGLTLASDAAAFWDMSLDESTSHLNSFINGSYEGGEAIGLFANDTQMAMYAVEQGIIADKKEWANLQESIKQATRMQYAENMMKLSGATGQASKEASQYANVQANLTEKWRQFKAQIGEPILQNIVTPAMAKLCDLIDAMSAGYEKASGWIRDNKDKIVEWTGYIVSAGVGVGTFLLYLNWGSIMAAAAKALDVVTFAIKRMTTALMKNPIGLIIGLIAALITYLIYLYNTNDDFRKFVDETLAEIWAKIQEVIGWLKDNALPIIQEVIGWIKENVLPVIQEVIGWVQENVIPVVQMVVDWLVEKIGAFWQWISEVFTSGKDNVGGIWETIKGFFQSAWDFIVGIWQACQPFFQSVWDGVIMPVWGLIQEMIGAFQMAWDVIKLVWGYVQPYFAGLWEGIKAAVSILWTFLSTGFKNAWEMIKLVWGVVVEYFRLVWTGIKAVFSVVVTFLGGFFRTAWEVIKAVWNVAIAFFTMVWAGIKAVFAVVKGVLSGDFSDAWEAIKNVWDKVKGYFSAVWNGIKGIFGAVGSWFGNTFSAAWEAVKKVFSGWGKFFSGLWDKITNTFKNIGSNIANAIGSSVKTGLNGVLSMIEGAINSGIGLINGAIRLANKLPGVDVGTISKISLPRLARGGVVDKPTIAEIGENGAEAVVPLEKNTGWIKNLANQITEFGAEGKAGGLDETLIDRLVMAIKSEVGDRLGRLENSVATIYDILAQFFPELLDALELSFSVDGRELATALAVPMDEALGKIAIKKGRGR